MTCKLSVLLTLSCLLLHQVWSAALNDPHIIGGSPATLGQIPWQVSLRINGRHVCGGSIINNKWVISAAHCFSGASGSELTVAAGFLSISRPEASQQTIKVAQFLIHEGYASVTDENDIAMVELEGAFTYNSYVQPIMLPTAGYDPIGVGVVSGWGTTESSQPSDKLMWVELPLMDDDFCREFLGGIVVDSMLCAGYEDGGKDACSGDSGGPLTCQENSQTVLCGIVSRGLGCAEPERPGIYTETSYYLDWIAATINN